MSVEYLDLYKELSENFEKINQIVSMISQPTQRLVCAVLLDDIEALMEECESFLIDGGLADDELEGFKMRYEVVTEEVSDVMKVLNGSSLDINKLNHHYR